MTNRYDLLLNAIESTNHFIVQMFLFAVLAVLAYKILGWLPVWLVRPARYLYIVTLLGLYFVTVFLSH